MLRRWKCTSLLTYEDDPKKQKISSTLEFESDSTVVLYYLRTKKERERYLEITKMRGTNHAREVYPFSIRKNGIAIGIKPASEKLEI